MCATTHVCTARRREERAPSVVLAIVHANVPLKVAELDLVCVDDADAPDTRRRQVEAHRRAEPARAHHQHRPAAPPLLPLGEKRKKE